MPFSTLSSDGLSITCFLPEVDWQAKFAVSFFFAGDVTAGLSDRESRTPEAEALLLTLTATVAAEDAEAQALRQVFATLGKGWVGFPLLADSFLGAEAATSGARAFTPQRLLDLTVPAIVPNSGPLDPAHTYAPLVVGHITELPPLVPLSGALALCAVTLTEDSPWEFRLAAALAPAAGAFPAALLPDWTSPPTQTPVHGLEFGRIGQQREHTIAGEERAFRWTVEAGFTLVDKTEIATLIGFFAVCRGQWAPFTAPLWFTPGTATAEAPHETKVRFTDAVLKLELTSTHLAAARVKFSQVPWEITGTAGETPQQPARLFLYQVTYDVPGPVVYRFTNCWRSLTRSGDGIYAPAPMQHANIEGGLDLGNEQVTLNSFLFPGNPLALFNPNVLEGRLLLRIFEIATEPINPDAAVLAWFGSIVAAPQTGRKFAAVGKWRDGLLDRELPGVLIGPGCNVSFLSPPCGHLKSAWLKAGTLTAAADNIITVTAADAAAANTYAPGRFEIGSGLTYESRAITASAPVAGGQQFTLDRALRTVPAGQACTYLRSCDGSLARCQELDPTGWRGRFRGHPFLPQVNLSLPTAAGTQPSGKK